MKTDIPVMRKPDGSEELAPPVMRVIDKVRHVRDIQRADFEFLKANVSKGRTPKVTIPSPTMLHFRGGRAGISEAAYPDLDHFLRRRHRLCRRTALPRRCRGRTYVQMDDTNLAYLCDENMREAVLRGHDPTNCRIDTRNSSIRS